MIVSVHKRLWLIVKKKSLWIKPGHFLKVNLRPYSTYCTFLIKPYLSTQFTFTASNYAPAACRKIKRNKTSFNYSDCSGHFVAHPLKLFAFSHLPAHKFQQVSEGGGGGLFFSFYTSGRVRLSLLSPVTNADEPRHPLEWHSSGSLSGRLPAVPTLPRDVLGVKRDSISFCLFEGTRPDAAITCESEGGLVSPRAT